MSRRRRRSGIRRKLLIAALLLLATPVVAIAAMRWVPPPTTAFMLQSPVQPVRQQWAPLEAIAPVLAQAVVASEDQNFPRHHGFDFAAISDAIREGGDGGPQRGASTISQQVAKNLFLWPGGGYARKGIEAGLTVFIELLWPKRRILEIYQNIAELAPGVFGAEAAAMHYFERSAATLDADQASRLAAVLPAPRRWKAEPPDEHVLRRTLWIREQMAHVTPSLNDALR